MEYEKLRSMPKVELHCHLDGSLSQTFISRELGREVDLTELQVAYGCRSLKEYLEKFDLPIRCLQTEKSVREAGYDFIRSVAAENMKYVEVRFAPLFSAHEGFSTEQVIEALLTGLEDGRKDFGTESNVIVCAMRHQPEEKNLAMFKAARTFLGEGVCCGDLAGDEAAWPMKNFVRLFGEAKKLGLPFVIHAGECGSAENIREAVPMPPFSPKQMVPAPAPTAPSSTPVPADVMADNTCCCFTGRRAIWLSRPSLHSPTTGFKERREMPSCWQRFSVYSTSASDTRPTFNVLVSAMGVSMVPSS